MIAPSLHTVQNPFTIHETIENSLSSPGWFISKDMYMTINYKEIEIALDFCCLQACYRTR